MKTLHVLHLDASVQSIPHCASHCPSLARMILWKEWLEPFMKNPPAFAAFRRIHL